MQVSSYLNLIGLLQDRAHKSNAAKKENILNDHRGSLASPPKDHKPCTTFLPTSRMEIAQKWRLHGHSFHLKHPLDTSSADTNKREPALTRLTQSANTLVSRTVFALRCFQRNPSWTHLNCRAHINKSCLFSTYSNNAFSSLLYFDFRVRSEQYYGLRKLWCIKGQPRVRCGSGKYSGRYSSWSVLQLLFKTLKS